MIELSDGAADRIRPAPSNPISGVSFPMIGIAILIVFVLLAAASFRHNESDSAFDRLDPNLWSYIRH